MVTGSAWRKNNRRELRHSLGRFLAIVAIVALGVGFFAGLKVAQPAMLRTGSQYVQKTELFDYRLVSTLGLTQEDADYFAGLDGVRAAEGARSVDLTAEFDGEGMTLKALTLLGLIGTEHCMTPPSFVRSGGRKSLCRTYSTAGGKHSPTAAVDIRQALKLAHLSLYMSFFRLSTKI